MLMFKGFEYFNVTQTAEIYAQPSVVIVLSCLIAVLSVGNIVFILIIIR